MYIYQMNVTFADRVVPAQWTHNAMIAPLLR